MQFPYVIGLMVAIASAANIDSRVFDNIEKHGSSDVLVSFKNTDHVRIRRQIAYKHRESDQGARTHALYKTLKKHADRVQSKLLPPLRRSVTTESVDMRQLWISNQLIIRNATEEIIRILKRSTEVDNVEADRMIPLIFQDLNEGQSRACKVTTKDTVLWGLSKIGVEKLWAKGIRGKNVVVGSIDTGVQYSHESVQANYRHEYGWLDPYDGTSTPTDDVGHGTHTMGTMVGQTRSIGIAPDAKWIACKGCSREGCSVQRLKECGQWFACPSHAAGHCQSSPLVAFHGWGYDGSDNFYMEILDAYDAIGIHAVFPIGNSGPRCGSTLYPGDSGKVIGVGATAANNSIMSFSSLGPPPGENQIIKPDVSAPGERICSASHLSGNGYIEFEGTTVAASHVAGLMALILSNKPSLSVQQLRKCIQGGAKPTTTTAGTCGGRAGGSFPNFYTGHGTVSATGTYECARNAR